MSQRVIQLVCPGCGAKVASNESDLVLCHDEPVLIRCYKTSVEHGFRDMFSQQKIKFMLQHLILTLNQEAQNKHQMTDCNLSLDDEHQERFCSSTHRPILPSAPMQ